MKFCVMKETKNIILVWKAQGIPSTPGKNIKNSLITMLTDELPYLKKVEGYKKNEFGLINRLDNQTAGVLIVAKNKETFNKLKDIMKEEKIIKTYLAQSHNLGREKKGIIKTPIAHHKRKKSKMVLAINPEQYRGKPQQAETEFELISEKKAKEIWKIQTNNKIKFPVIENTNRNEETTWVLCRIRKGKRHQIRIHLASKGYPIMFDDLYSYKAHKEFAHKEHHRLYSIGIEITEREGLD